MDKIARALSIDPAELRRKNLLRDGETTATGQAVVDAGASIETFDAALARSGYQKKVKAKEASGGGRRASAWRASSTGRDSPAAGELYLMAQAGVRLTEKGSVGEVIAASTEIGQGTRTAFSQIVADTLGLPFEAIDVADPTPPTFPIRGRPVASRTIAVVGRIIADAAGDLDVALRSHAGLDRATPWSEEKFRATALRWLEQGNPARFVRTFGNPAQQVWDDKTYRGDAYGALRVGPPSSRGRSRSGELRSDRHATDQCAGDRKAIHPRLAEGQIEGGTTQALGGR